MAEMCTFTSKDAKGKVSYSCGLVAQEGSTFCPRHTFLHNTGMQAEDRKEREKHATRLTAAGGMPRFRAEMIERGYQYLGCRDCVACHLPIEMWRTPMGRNAPFNPMPEINSHATSHFATCVRAKDFRRSACDPQRRAR